jgi:3-oxoacyl-[acyl-carrier-protein] synthase-3
LTYFTGAKVKPIGVEISSFGMALPDEIESAVQLSKKIGRSADWIKRRSGVLNRHISNISMPELAAKAARIALGDGPRPDLIINASGVAYQVLPDTSVFIQQELGFEGIPSFSIHATCLSFIVALQNAASLIETGVYERVLIVSADLGSRGRNFDEPESAALLGDGAAAVVLEASESASLLAYHFKTWPSGAKHTEVRGGGTRLHPQNPKTTHADNLFSMNGPAVFKMARKLGGPMIQELVDKAGLKKSDIDLVVPHQASGFGVRVYTRYGFDEDKIVNVVAEQGNCVAASIPMALVSALQSGRIKSGDNIMLIGTGAGLSIGGLILRW